MKVFSNLKDFFFSRVCPFCGNNINFSDAYVCNKCKDKLCNKNDIRCARCGRNMDIVCGDENCPSCRNSKLFFDRNVSALNYNETVRTAVLKYKFHKALWMSCGFAELLYEAFKKEYDNYSFDCIIPVPISIYRYVNRGYNQSELMGVHLSKLTKIPMYDNVLYKMVDNPAQSTLGHAQRSSNVKNVYKIFNENLIIDKTVLLIDDVFTTGATLNECSSLLKKHGAVYVGCLTLAYVGH